MLTLRSGLLRCGAVALALVAGISPLAAQATTGSIAGQITDSASKAPLAGARIQIVGTQLVATTRAEGRFTIRSVPAGEYELRVIAVAYSLDDLVLCCPCRSTSRTTRSSRSA